MFVEVRGLGDGDDDSAEDVIGADDIDKRSLSPAFVRACVISEKESTSGA